MLSGTWTLSDDLFIYLIDGYSLSRASARTLGTAFYSFNLHRIKCLLVHRRLDWIWSISKVSDTGLIYGYLTAWQQRDRSWYENQKRGFWRQISKGFQYLRAVVFVLLLDYCWQIFFQYSPRWWVLEINLSKKSWSWIGQVNCGKSVECLENICLTALCSPRQIVRGGEMGGV